MADDELIRIPYSTDLKVQISGMQTVRSIHFIGYVSFHSTVFFDFLQWHRKIDLHMNRARNYMSG